MLTIDESLKDITGATYTRWVEHDTPNGNWSRRQFQKTVRTITPEQVRYLATHPLPGEKRRHIGGTPPPRANCCRTRRTHAPRLHTRIPQRVTYTPNENNQAPPGTRSTRAPGGASLCAHNATKQKRRRDRDSNPGHLTNEVAFETAAFRYNLAYSRVHGLVTKTSSKSHSVVTRLLGSRFTEVSVTNSTLVSSYVPSTRV